jgi:hypothetical protein
VCPFNANLQPETKKAAPAAAKPEKAKKAAKPAKPAQKVGLILAYSCVA